MPVLKVTEAARAMVIDARAAEPDAERLALWLEVGAPRDGQWSYDLYFQASSDARPGDAVIHHDDITVIVPERSISALAGATLDVSGEGDDADLVVSNPNTAPVVSPVAGSPAGLSGLPEGASTDLGSDLALRVIAVLDEQVNPGIAMHGGAASLVAIDDSSGVAYLALSGGCQGCGLARVTLSQGIEVAIRDMVPEVTSVVDVTDHASGTDPYFEAAKK